MSRAASALLTALAAEKNGSGFCGIPVRRISTICNCPLVDVHKVVQDLILAGSVELRAVAGNVFMFKVVTT